jgi:SPP1 gp7 family putative phage head morphogenesis protein
MRDIEVRWSKRLRAYFHGLEQETLKNLRSIKGWTAFEIKSELRRKASIEQIIFDMARANERLMKLSSPLQKEAMQRGGDNLIADLGLGVAFDMDNPVARAKLAEITLRMQGVNVRLERRIREVLIDGFNEGSSIEQMATALSSEFEFPLKRSRMIARTETGVALNMSRNLAMRQVGIKRHQWLSARDPDVRESHVAEDGSTVIIGTAFPKTKLLYPQDPSGPAREVINCRCVAIPVKDR